MIIGLDIGGTHTDVVLIGEDCILRQSKVPTNPSIFLESVWTALEEVTRHSAGEHPPRSTEHDSDDQCHSGAKRWRRRPCSGGPEHPSGMLRTCKHYFFRLGVHQSPWAGDSTRRRDGNRGHRGTPQVRRDSPRGSGESKFSVRNPKHEVAIRDILGNDFENIVLGHRLSGNLSFPAASRRPISMPPSTPYIKFFQAVQDSLQKRGLNIPIYILKADGGTMSLEASLNSPGQTILSGPAASVMGSLPFSSETDETLVLDIGGTTTDMAVLIRRVPLLDQ